MYNTYKQIRSKMLYLEPFHGNSACGFFNSEGSYIVRSYNTDILRLDPNTQTIYFDNSYYSVTTSKLQNMVKWFIFNKLQSTIKAIERKIYNFDLS